MTSIDKFLDSLFEDISLFISKDLQIEKHKLDESINKFRNKNVSSNYKPPLKGGSEPITKLSNKGSKKTPSTLLSKEEINKLVFLKRDIFKALNNAKYLCVDTRNEIIPTSTYAKKRFVINNEYKIAGIKDSEEYLTALKLLDYDKENPEVFREVELNREKDSNLLLLNSLFIKQKENTQEPLELHNVPEEGEPLENNEPLEENEDLDSLLSKFD